MAHHSMSWQHSPLLFVCICCWRRCHHLDQRADLINDKYHPIHCKHSFSGPIVVGSVPAAVGGNCPILFWFSSSSFSSCCCCCCSVLGVFSVPYVVAAASVVGGVQNSHAQPHPVQLLRFKSGHFQSNFLSYLAWHKSTKLSSIDDV